MSEIQAFPRTLTGSSYFATFALVLLVSQILSPIEATSTSSTVLNSSNEELERQSTDSSSHTASKVNSIEDLFRNYSDDLSRLSAAYDMISVADEAKLIDLFDQATGRNYTKENSLWKSELISLIGNRLATMNLDKTVSLYESLPLEDAKNMLYGMMRAWARLDFDEAVEFARQQVDSVHPIALRGIVDASLSLPATTLIDLGVELGDESYVKSALATHRLELELADPEQAWESLIEDPTIHQEENFERVQTIANAMIDLHGANEVPGLLGSVTSPSLKYTLKKNLLSKIALSDPETAFNFALDTPNDVFGTMLSVVIDTWAITNPETALSRVSLLEPSAIRDDLQERIVAAWVQQDPFNFETTSTDIPVELRDTARQSVVEILSETAIEDALKVLPEIADLAKQQQAAQAIADSWMKSDIEATFQWLTSSAEIEEFRIFLLRSFFEKMTTEDADRAFDLALSLPIGEDEDVGLEAIVIEHLINFDTDRALLLLSRVRPGNTQLATYESVAGILLIRYQIDKAIELGKQLPENLQAQYYDKIAVSIATGVSPTKILEVLPDIPVEKARSRVAEFVLLFHSAADEEDRLSDEDVEAMLKHVVPADLERVRFILQP
ncbi:MAG: hypothetical protein OXH31_00920 [Gammaproteobacteria bacterium]|nr:hypothetical protein [Gammaproteobacteria bacterium]